MRGEFITAWLLLMAGLPAGAATYLSDTRAVSVSVQTPNPPALGAYSGATNNPSAPFADLHLGAGCSIGWQEVNGWTASPAMGAATQEVSITESQITVVNNLSVSVGGDPFGFHFPTPASGTVRADALFQVSFFVASLTDYDYTFEFSQSPTLESAVLTLGSLNHGTQQLFSTSGSPVTGVLEADTYTLTCNFSSFASGDRAGNNFSSLVVNFGSSVPEPSTGALVLLGLVVLGAWRRKATK